MKRTLPLLILVVGLFTRVSAQIVFQSDFETWTGVQAVTGWNGSATNITSVSTDSAKIDSIAPYHGTRCIKFVNTTTTAKRFSTQPLSVTAGVVYNVRFWAKGAGSIRAGLYGAKHSTGFGYEYASYATVNSPTWTVYNQELLADSTNSAAQFLFSVKSTLAANGNLAVDSVTITQVGTASVQSLYNIQYTTATPANSPFMNQFVTTSGIVTGVYLSGTPATQSGYYVQTTGSHAWGAVNVYDYSHPVAMGDSIIFSGYVQEYYNETEIAQVCNFTKVSTGNPQPAATVVGFDNIQNEKYEGLLVKAKHIRDIRYNTAQAWSVFSDSTNMQDSVGSVMYHYTFTPNKVYSVTGVVKFYYSNLIEPRMVGDIDSSASTTGVVENTMNAGQFNVYPNPSNGVFTIYTTADKSDKNEITLTNVLGQVVYREEHVLNMGANSIELNASGLNKGIYFVGLNNGQTKEVKKIIIK